MPYSINPFTGEFDRIQGPGSGTAAIEFAGDSGTANPTSSGVITVIGSTIAKDINSKPVFVSATGSTLTEEVQVAKTLLSAPSDKLSAGLCSFDGNTFAVDSDGHVTQISTGIDTACSNFIVDRAGTKSDYTTIASAISAASSGDTVFIKTGTYTEDLTMKAGVNLVSFAGEQRGTNVQIVGKLSASFSGTVVIAGLSLVTNGDLCIDVTGSNATLFEFWDCFINAFDNQAIHLNSSSLSRLRFVQCTLNANGFKMIDASAGRLSITRSNLATTASSNSNTVSTVSVVGITMTTSNQTFISSGVGNLSLSQCNFATGNSTALTCGGTGGHRIEECLFNTGTASSISISAGASASVLGCGIRNTNSAAITGAGSITYTGLFFSQSGSTIDVTTQTLRDIGPDVTIPGVLGVGVVATDHTLEVLGHVGINTTSTIDDAHSLEIIANASSFADFKAIDIDYITGALAAGEEDSIILVNIDETAALGGEIFALEVLTTTEGTDIVGGLKTGVGIDAIHQETGTFGNIDEVLNKLVDVTAAVASGGAGGISMFVADDDTILMGDAAQWDETEVLIATGASGGGVAPAFEFSVGGTSFTGFVPVDGTNGFKNTGVIDWNSADLSGWVTNASGRFEIRITRTRNTLTTTPIVDTLQLAAATEHSWNKDGDLVVNSITLTTDLTVANGGTGASTLLDNGVLVGSGTSAITALTVGTDGQILLGSSAADPVFATATSSDSLLTLTLGAGSLDIVAQDATSAASALTDNAVVRGNGGATGVQTSTMLISDAGEMTNPSQPAFSANNSVGDSSVTGAGTAFTVEFNAERFDQNGDYNNTTDTFTAPVTGRYQFNVSVAVKDLTSAMTLLTLSIVTSGVTYVTDRCNPFAQEDGSAGTYTSKGVLLADMTAADTCSVSVKISNGVGDDATVRGGSLQTMFSGFLVC